MRRAAIAMLVGWLCCWAAPAEDTLKLPDPAPKPRAPSLTVTRIAFEEAEKLADTMSRVTTARTAESASFLSLRLPKADAESTPQTVRDAAELLRTLGFKDRDILRTVGKENIKTLADLKRALPLREADKPFTFMVDRAEDRKARIIIQVDKPLPAADSEQGLPVPMVQETAPGVMDVQGNQLEDQYADADPLAVLSQLQPRLWRSPDGKTVGITSDRFSAIPLAGQLGIQDGDIIVGVNGVTIQNEADIFTAIDQLQGATTFTGTIIRGGRPITVTVNVR